MDGQLSAVCASFMLRSGPGRERSDTVACFNAKLYRESSPFGRRRRCSHRRLVAGLEGAHTAFTATHRTKYDDQRWKSAAFPTVSDVVCQSDMQLGCACFAIYCSFYAAT